MALGLDDALLGWLVQGTGDALLGRLRDSPTQAAMRAVVDEAVEAAVNSLAGHLDQGQAEHLRDVLGIREVWLETPAPVSSRAGLQAALRTWTAALDQPEFDEAGYLSQLGVDPQRLAETLTSQIITGISRNARSGGPLNQLAEWLWHDDLEGRVDEIQRGIARLQPVAEPPGPAGSGLPGGIPDFTGRKQQLALLAERVQEHDPVGVVVAIHAVDGMAGVGKTELALRAAHQHKQRYPDAQYFLNLHGYTEDIPPLAPAAGLEELLRQAGLTGPQIATDLAGRQARWRALMAGKRALVLLDNAIDAQQVRPLLPGAAGCLVLVTSRTRLADLPGVRTLPLDVLPAAEAVQLFCRIADDTGANPDPEAVAKVVEIVGWLPVAIRAVAAQVGADYSVAELATDLAEAKQQLVLTGAAGLLGTGVAAAFDTSMQRLDAPHQQAYRILGIHPGPTIGVPQFAALAGLPIPQAATTLRKLAAGNLLTPVDEQIGHRRWQQHDLLRDHSRHYASSHLSSEQRSSALAQLTTWYASALAQAKHVMDDTGNAAAPVVEGLKLDRADQAWAWLAAEQDNLLAYARQASGYTAAHLCRRYAYRLYLLGHNEAARVLYRAAVGIYQEIGHRAGRADALTGLGRVTLALGEVPAARDHFQAAVGIYQEIGHRAGRADALTGIGEVAEADGRHDEARALWQEAQAIVISGNPLAEWLRRKLQDGD
jgi:tetratricopeptide (TPR) repeat protein